MAHLGRVDPLGYLTREWNEYMRGKSLRDGCPEIVVGCDLLEAVGKALLERNDNCLTRGMHRSCILRSEGDGWQIVRIEWNTRTE